MKKFATTTEFMTGAFLGGIFATVFFTFLLTYCYTSNDLLKHSGFYRDGKMFQVGRKCEK